MVTRTNFASGAFNFNKDLPTGFQVQCELAELLKARKTVLDVTHNDNYKYDLIVKMSDGSIRTIEVKNDLTSARTGNVGVEFECRGNPSGISKCIAEFWAFRLLDGFYMLHADKLKRLIAEQRYHRIGIGGDDGSNTKLYLFYIEDFKKEAQKV
jgi:hypothetical protein